MPNSKTLIFILFKNFVGVCAVYVCKYVYVCACVYVGTLDKYVYLGGCTGEVCVFRGCIG